MAVRKSITFDLDTKVADKILGNYRKAHKDIQNFMEKHEFLHPQYSVYESSVPMTNVQVRATINDLLNEHPYLTKCVRDMRVTNVQKEYILNNMFSYDGTPGEWAKENHKSQTDYESMSRQELEDLIFSGGAMQTGNAELGRNEMQMGEEDITLE